MDEPHLQQFYNMLTPEMKAKAEEAGRRDMPSTKGPNGRTMLPSMNISSTFEGTESQMAFLKNMTEVKPQFPPLESLPCANVEIGKVCQQRGAMACNACKLVSYCSKASLSVSI